MHSSKNVVNSNGFQDFWKPFTRFFQALCVAHYSIYRQNLRGNRLKSVLFLMYFLCISAVHISLVVSTMRKGLRCENEIPEHRFAKHKESAVMYYVNSFTMIGAFVTHLTSHLEPLLCGKREEDIYKELKSIDQIFTSKLNYVIDYKIRRVKYIKHNVGTFVLASILAISSSFTTLPDMYHDKYFLQPILIFAVIINRGRWCYIAFFLNAIADTLDDLQILLIEQQLQSHKQSIEPSKCNYVRENIKYLREIYTRVCLVVSSTSDCFGFSLITFLLEFTVEIISACYWLYINFSFYGSMDLNIRKEIETSFISHWGIDPMI